MCAFPRWYKGGGLEGGWEGSKGREGKETKREERKGRGRRMHGWKEIGVVKKSEGKEENETKKEMEEKKGGRKVMEGLNTSFSIVWRNRVTISYLSIVT